MSPRASTIRPWVASTRTQSPVRISAHGSWSRSVTAGTRVTTAPSADLVLIRVMTMATGAVPSRRVLWKKPDQPELPLADGKTSTLPVNATPFSACLDSMMRPVLGSIPPQPGTGSGETRASPSA